VLFTREWAQIQQAEQLCNRKVAQQRNIYPFILPATATKDNSSFTTPEGPTRIALQCFIISQMAHNPREWQLEART